MRHNEQTKTELTKNLSPLGAWAFAIGTSIGWGSLVVTNNAYLAQAGPLGSVIGMVIGAIVMLLISRNYSYLMNAYPDSGGAYTYYRLMRQKAEHSERQLGHVRNLAYTDALTGVKSKLAYCETEEELNEMISQGQTAPFAVVVCDVNGLKFINDTQGHKAGDAYIKSAAKMICSMFVHSPVYRMGGDEFVVILSNTDYLNRSVIMKQLHDTSVENIKKGDVVVSAGISDYKSGVTKNVKSIFEKADTLMYEEKKLLKSLGAETRL